MDSQLARGYLMAELFDVVLDGCVVVHQSLSGSLRCPSLFGRAAIGPMCLVCVNLRAIIDN